LAKSIEKGSGIVYNEMVVCCMLCAVCCKSINRGAVCCY